MNPQEFDNIFVHYKRIKHERVDEQLKFYTDKVQLKHLFAQWSGLVILVISLSIPIVTNLDIQASKMVVTLMSLSIALVSGLEGLFQWRTTWKEYSKAIVRIKTLIASWEVKVAKARELSNSIEVSKALGDATLELINKVEETTFAEMGTFFSVRLADSKQQTK